MAASLDYLTLKAANMSDGMSEWSYLVPDGVTETLSTIEGANWFNTIGKGFKKYDRIDIQASDGNAEYYVTSASGADTVTIAALGDANDIADGSVTASKLASNSVTNDKILDGTIAGNTKIVAASIGSAQISATAGILGSQLSPTANIAGTQLAAGANIAGTQLAASTITIDRMAANSVGTNNVVDASITKDKLASSSVGTDELEDNAVDSQHYTDGSIDTAHYAANSVDNAALGVNAVTTTNVSDFAITSPKLANSSLVASKAANYATNDSDAGLLEVYRFSTSGGATANTDVVLNDAITIVAIYVKLEAAGTAGDTVQIQTASGANNISNVLNIATGQAGQNFSTFVMPTYDEVAAGATIRIAQVDGGSSDSPALRVSIIGYKHA